jgi:hypothetical protein
MQATRREGSGKRAPLPQEARHLLLSALATAGAKWLNIREKDGRPLAVALIPDAQFCEEGKSLV